MKFNDIIKEIKAEKYRPVYFLMGEEPYFIDAIERLIEEKVLNKDEKEFNQSILYGKDISTDQILSEARSYPMMASHRVVIIREAQNIKDWDMLDPYFAMPVETTILVICHKYKALDKRKSTAKVLDKNAQCVLFSSEKIKDYKIVEWIREYCKDNKINIQSRAIDFLAEYIGAEPSKIANEIDKLQLAIGSNVEITHEHIMQNVGIHKEFNIFELNKALAQKNMSRAVKITDYFVQNQKSHNFHALNPQFYSFFSKLMLYKYYQRFGKNESEINQLLGLHYGNKDDFQQASKHYSLPACRRILLEISDADLRSKGINNVSMDTGEVLRDLVYKILFL